jgi:hypothetical protein
MDDVMIKPLTKGVHVGMQTDTGFLDQYYQQRLKEEFD